MINLPSDGARRVFMAPANTEALVFDGDKAPVALTPDGAGPMVELQGVVDAHIGSDENEQLPLNVQPLHGGHDDDETPLQRAHRANGGRDS